MGNKTYTNTLENLADYKVEAAELFASKSDVEHSITELEQRLDNKIEYFEVVDNYDSLTRIEEPTIGMLVWVQQSGGQSAHTSRNTQGLWQCTSRSGNLGVWKKRLNHELLVLTPRQPELATNWYLYGGVSDSVEQPIDLTQTYSFDALYLTEISDTTFSKYIQQYSAIGLPVKLGDTTRMFVFPTNALLTDHYMNFTTTHASEVMTALLFTYNNTNYIAKLTINLVNKDSLATPYNCNLSFTALDNHALPTFKTIEGQTITGSGNISIPTYSPFDLNWRTDTVDHLIADINADANAVVGKSYLGEVDTVTAEEGLFNGNAEIVVNIMNGSGTHKVIWCIVSSNNVAPYHWEATYSSGSISAKGWTGYQPKLTTTSITQDNTLQEVLGFDTNHQLVRGVYQPHIHSIVHFSSVSQSIITSYDEFIDLYAAFSDGTSLPFMMDIDDQYDDGNNKGNTLYYISGLKYDDTLQQYTLQGLGLALDGTPIAVVLTFAVEVVDNDAVLNFVSCTKKPLVELPDMPQNDGHYQLEVTVASGVPTLSWELKS